MADAAEIKTLGPLAALLGKWEGDKGNDRAPDDNRGVETNLFREVTVFEPTGLVQNHEQHLYGLRYRTNAWRLGEPNPFHEDIGYWLWDQSSGLVMKCFVVPRGVSVIAGGKVAGGDKKWRLLAEVGSTVFGICSSPFLSAEFKTIKYELTITFDGADRFSYESNSVLEIKGKAGVFDHVDRNVMKRVG